MIDLDDDEIEVVRFEQIEHGEWRVDIRLCHCLNISGIQVQYQAKSGVMLLHDATGGASSLMDTRLGKRIALAILEEYRLHIRLQFDARKIENEKYVQRVMHSALPLHLRIPGKVGDWQSSSLHQMRRDNVH